MSQKRSSRQAGVEVAVVMFDLEVTEHDGTMRWLQLCKVHEETETPSSDVWQFLASNDVHSSLYDSLFLSS